MYLLFRLKRWKPSEYFWEKPGEKKIIRAFLIKEIEERNKEAEALNGGG